MRRIRLGFAVRDRGLSGAAAMSPRLQDRVSLHWAVAVLTVSFFLVMAAHAAAATITVSVTDAANGGSGTISGGTINDPQGIVCSGPPPTPVAPGLCSKAFSGSILPVTLTAVADPGSTFIGWGPSVGAVGDAVTGCAQGSTANPCSFSNGAVTLTKEVTAIFGQAASSAEVEIDPVDPDEVGVDEATLRGSVDANGSLLTACRFEVVKQSDPAGFGSGVVQSFPCDPDPDEIGTGSADVEATATGLEPNTVYRVRLVAEKQLASPPLVSDEADDPFTTDVAPPAVTTGGNAWSVSDTAGTLTGLVNPRNSTTICGFEYVSQDQFDLDGFASADEAPCVSPPTPGNATVQVIGRLDDLSPSTIYHVRVFADNGTGGRQLGLDTTFTTRPPIVFPRRGIELVSAFDTNGVTPLPNLASNDGNYYAYTSNALPLPSSETGQFTPFRSVRNSDGTWSQRYVGAPSPGPNATGLLVPQPLYSGDLSLAVWGTANGNSFDPDDTNNSDDTYMRNANDGSLTWISRDPAIPVGNPQPPRTVTETASQVRYISPKGNRILFESSARLLPADVAAPGLRSLYQWNEGTLSLIGVQPGNGDGFGTGSALGSQSNTFGNPWKYGNGVTRNAVSADGTRVVFRSGSSPDDAAARLYIRIDGEHTVEASGSSFDPTPVSVEYWGADSDVRNVFFTSGSPLTLDSTAPDTSIDKGSGTGGYADLYRYSVPDNGDQADGELVDLTPEVGGAGVMQVLWVSNDARQIYFLANKQIQGLGSSDSTNLFLAQLDGPDDETAEFTLIASGELSLASTGVGGKGLTREKFRQVSANSNARVIAFRSAHQLIPDRPTGGLPQVYVYESARDTLSCASCPLDGSTPTSWASLTPVRYAVGTEIGHDGQINADTVHVRNVATDGAVVFQTSSQLLPTDQNDKSSVYEWRGGKLRLVSVPGTFDSAFGDMSADGSTIFFYSANDEGVPGVPGIAAGVYRIYAARVGGGVLAPPLIDSQCLGDTCRGASSISQTRAAIGSINFIGNGDAPSFEDLAIGVSKLKAAFGSAAKLKVRVPDAGRVLVAGPRIRTTTRSTSKAGVLTVWVRLNSHFKAELRKRERLRVSVRVTYRANDGRTTSKKTLLVFKRPKYKRVRLKGGMR